MPLYMKTAGLTVGLILLSFLCMNLAVATEGLTGLTAWYGVMSMAFGLGGLASAFGTVITYFE